MKRFLPLVAAGLLGAVFASAAIYWEMATENANAASPSPAGQGLPHAAGPGDGAGAATGPTERVLFQVDGISCGSCEAKIRKALEANAAVIAVVVNLDERTVAVEYREGGADPKALAEAVTRAGYPARFVASGPSVPAVPKAGAARTKGCAGSCCAGKS